MWTGKCHWLLTGRHRNTGAPHTMHWSPLLHSESVGQEQACALRAKIGVITSDLACHPAVQSAVVGHSDSGQYGEEARIHPNFSHLFSEQASPPLPLPHPSAPSYLTQLIETLNVEIKSCTIHPFYE